MGRNGRDFVRHNYRWDVVLAKYERMIGKIQNAQGGRGVPPGHVTTTAVSLKDLV